MTPHKSITELTDWSIEQIEQQKLAIEKGLDLSNLDPEK